VRIERQRAEITHFKDVHEPSRARLVLLTGLLTVLVSIGVCVASVLAPAPAAALPLVVVICVGCPLFAAWEAPMALAAVRAQRAGGNALSRLRESLDRLPEVEHPLGL
jgi:hypothetical protein